MKYYQHGETGRVVATEAELIGEWYEIEKDQYEDALHPLSRPTPLAPDGAEPLEHTGIPETCKHPECVRLFQSPAGKA